MNTLNYVDGYSKRAYTVKYYGRLYIKSYNTLVAYVDRNGNIHRLWNEWSATTQKHINKSGVPMDKKTWQSLKVEKMDRTAKAVDILTDQLVGMCKWKYTQYGAELYDGRK